MSRQTRRKKLFVAALAWGLLLSIHMPSGVAQEADPSEPGEPTRDLGEFPAVNLDTKRPGPPPAATSEQKKKWLSDQIARAIAQHPILANATIGVAIYDMAKKEWVYQRNAQTQFNVASNTKVITAVAALSLLGPDFRFQTTLAAERVEPDGSIPGDLYIRSLADPTLGTWDLHEMAEQLAILGIKRVAGGISVDDTYFDENNLPPHFDEQPREQAGFRAPVGATSLNFNTMAIVVTPNPAGQGPARVVVDPANDYGYIEGLVQTVKSGRTNIRVETKSKRGRLEIKVSGQIREEVSVRRIRRRVPNPSAYLGATLRRMLAKHGVSVGRRKVRTRALPARAKVLASRQSPALAEVIRGLGKYSNNYVAEMILKTIGAESLTKERPATWNDALSAVKAFLVANVGLKDGKFRYGNGSGLFDSNRFTPEQMVKVLRNAYTDFRIGPDFVSSLSIAGADGTLRRRMTDGPASRQVRAKTGTLAHVSALAGYLGSDSRSPLCFAVFVNDVPKWRINDARSVADSIAESAILYSRSGD